MLQFCVFNCLRGTVTIQYPAGMWLFERRCAYGHDTALGTAYSLTGQVSLRGDQCDSCLGLCVAADAV